MSRIAKRAPRKTPEATFSVTFLATALAPVLASNRFPRARFAGLFSRLGLLAVCAVFAGCTAMGDNIPASMGGLPASAPARPAAPAAYPLVHDMPPPRAAPVLDDDAQQRLERDLTNARNRQEGRKPEIAGKPGAKGGAMPAAKRAGTKKSGGKKLTNPPSDGQSPDEKKAPQ